MFREAEIRDSTQVNQLVNSIGNLKDKDIPVRVLGPIMRSSEEGYARYLDLAAALTEQGNDMYEVFADLSQELLQENQRILGEYDREVQEYHRVVEEIEEYNRAQRTSSENPTIRPERQRPQYPLLSEKPEWKRYEQKTQKMMCVGRDTVTWIYDSVASKGRILEWFNNRIQQWNRALGYRQLIPEAAQFTKHFLKGTAGGAIQGDFFTPSNTAERVGQAVGQTAVSFTPAGPAADARDFATAVQEAQTQGFNWGTAKGIVLAIVGFIPGLGDAAKVFKREAARRRALAQANETQIREVTEAMSRRAAEYQTKITGMPVSHIHELNGVKFDGFKDGVLLEAKGLGYANFVKNGEFADWFKDTGLKSLLDQAKRQKDAAQGTRIQWHFAEEEPARIIRELFSKRGINIEVIVTP